MKMLTEELISTVFDSIVSNMKEEKSILTRTNNAISKYVNKVNSIEDSFFTNNGLVKRDVVDKINAISIIIENSINYFLSGDVLKAVQEIDDLFPCIRVKSIKKEKVFFRGRASSTNYLYHKEEMFHIPLNQRHLVKNQRYSLSGFPCLYLGEKTYTCWEELERPDFGMCNFVAFKTNREISLYDLSIPCQFKEILDFEVIPIIIASSMYANKTYDFKPEYIFPQLILHNLIRKEKDHNKIMGLMYHSTSLYYSEEYIFPFSKPILLEELDKYLCFVFPIVNHKSKIFCSKLAKTFAVTSSTSYDYINYQRGEKQLSTTPSSETNKIPQYKNSYFSDIDNVLFNYEFDKVNISSKRTHKAVMVEGKWYITIV